ncbi:MAG: hypothetical protein LBS55_11580 [Prevotellaceae bacterium]|jgi:hypothetical protein|nr:hypothetical protein [Prevotellaceae bacterium]
MAWRPSNVNKIRTAGTSPYSYENDILKQEIIKNKLAAYAERNWWYRTTNNTKLLEDIQRTTAQSSIVANEALHYWESTGDKDVALGYQMQEFGRDSGKFKELSQFIANHELNQTSFGLAQNLSAMLLQQELQAEFDKIEEKPEGVQDNLFTAEELALGIATIMNATEAQIAEQEAENKADFEEIASLNDMNYFQLQSYIEGDGKFKREAYDIKLHRQRRQRGYLLDQKTEFEVDEIVVTPDGTVAKIEVIGVAPKGKTTITTSNGKTYSKSEYFREASKAEKERFLNSGKKEVKSGREKTTPRQKLVGWLPEGAGYNEENLSAFINAKLQQLQEMLELGEISKSESEDYIQDIRSLYFLGQATLANPVETLRKERIEEDAKKNIAAAIESLDDVLDESVESPEEETPEVNDANLLAQNLTENDEELSEDDIKNMELVHELFSYYTFHTKIEGFYSKEDSDKMNGLVNRFLDIPEFRYYIEEQKPGMVIRVLIKYGMPNEALHEIFNNGTLTKLFNTAEKLLEMTELTTGEKLAQVLEDFSDFFKIVEANRGKDIQPVEVSNDTLEPQTRTLNPPRIETPPQSPANDNVPANSNLPTRKQTSTEVRTRGEKVIPIKTQSGREEPEEYSKRRQNEE